METITKKDGDKRVEILSTDYFKQVNVVKDCETYSWAVVSLSEDLFLRDYSGRDSLECLDCALKNLFEFLGLEVKR